MSRVALERYFFCLTHLSTRVTTIQRVPLAGRCRAQAHKAPRDVTIRGGSDGAHQHWACMPERGEVCTCKTAICYLGLFVYLGSLAGQPTRGDAGGGAG